jgi:hypothetical protein
MTFAALPALLSLAAERRRPYHAGAAPFDRSNPLPQRRDLERA